MMLCKIAGAACSDKRVKLQGGRLMSIDRRERRESELWCPDEEWKSAVAFPLTMSSVARCCKIRQSDARPFPGHSHEIRHESIFGSGACRRAKSRVPAVEERPKGAPFAPQLLELPHPWNQWDWSSE